MSVTNPHPILNRTSGFTWSGFDKNYVWIFPAITGKMSGFLAKRGFHQNEERKEKDRSLFMVKNSGSGSKKN